MRGAANEQKERALVIKITLKRFLEGSNGTSKVKMV